jgi:glycosyltransferase involved in cell wall biosynthesis
LVDQVESKPKLSVVVVVYNMAREAPRTLLSLSANYQRHIAADDYEVIVVDNGSNPPFDPREIEHLSGHFRLIRIDPAPPSPAQAINRGLAESRGEIIGVMIDGARLVTPGLLHFARHGARLYDRAVVATLGWYLGYDRQAWAIKGGYDPAREDQLLSEIDWPSDGYRLFEIATMDESSCDGWLAPIGEANALFMRRGLWDLLGGMDERFDVPGGGLANGDAFRRAADLPDAELVILIGEATFHQIHGGAATNAPVESFPNMLAKWNKQYEAIRGCSFDYPDLKNPPTYLGTLPRPALARFVRAAIDPVIIYSREPPLGPHFDRELWSLSPAAQPADPTIAALVDLARNEFRAHQYESAAAVLRLVRERAPDEREPQRLLSLIGSWLSLNGPPSERRAHYYSVLGEAYRLLGDGAAATSEYQEGD